LPQTVVMPTPVSMSPRCTARPPTIRSHMATSRIRSGLRDGVTASSALEVPQRRHRRGLDLSDGADP
jgi:hypothetical protein